MPFGIAVVMEISVCCRPVLTANQCLLNKVNECGLNEFESEPIFASGLRQLRSASVVVNYICRDHVEGTQYFVSL